MYRCQSGQNPGRKARRGYGLMSRNPLPKKWSGRPDSNRRRPAWEAGILPLNYGRSCPYSSLRLRPVKPGGNLFERHVVGLDQLVAAGLPVEPLARPVEVELLVERHRRHVVDPELVDPVVDGEPLLLVHLGLRLVHHAVEVRVAVVAEVAAGA